MKRKFFAAVILISLLTVSASAEGIKIGVMAKSAITEEEFNKKIAQSTDNISYDKGTAWRVLHPSHSIAHDKYIFYDTIGSMQMALDSGAIDEINLPQIVAEYLLSTNPGKYEVSCVKHMDDSLGYAFGFADEELQKKFDAALKELQSSGKYAELVASLEQLQLDNLEQLKPAEFEKFEGAETLKIAITGEIPPIDFIAPNGVPAGFNVALLSEIAKILKVNVELIHVYAEARLPTLISGRADVVFWFLFDIPKTDMPEGKIFLSSPYYLMDNVLELRLRSLASTVN